MMISLPISIPWLIFVIYLPFVLSCNNLCSFPCPKGQTCVTTDCSTHTCAIDVGARTFDLWLSCPPVVDPPANSICTPDICTDGDFNCYINAVYQDILSDALASPLNNQWLIYPPTTTDPQGLKYTFTATTWALPGNAQYSSAYSVATNLVDYLRTGINSACAQIDGDSYCRAYMGGASDTTLSTSPTIFNLHTCPDGTLIDAKAGQSCPVSNTSIGTRLLIIILPIIGGITALFIIIASIRRYRTKQIPPEQGTELQSTSQPSQV